MSQKFKNRIMSFVARHTTEFLIVIAGSLLILDVSREIPYLNIFLNNFLIKLFGIWLVVMFVFNVGYIYRTHVFIVILIFIATSYLFGSSSYENLGSIAYFLLLLIWYSHWKLLKVGKVESNE